MNAQEIKLIAWIRKGQNWQRADLDNPEFVGDGLRDIDDARDAAREAIDYIGEECESVEIHIDGELVETVSR